MTLSHSARWQRASIDTKDSIIAHLLLNVFIGLDQAPENSIILNARDKANRQHQCQRKHNAVAFVPKFHHTLSYHSKSSPTNKAQCMIYQITVTVCDFDWNAEGELYGIGHSCKETAVSASFNRNLPMLPVLRFPLLWHGPFHTRLNHMPSLWHIDWNRHRLVGWQRITVRLSKGDLASGDSIHLQDMPGGNIHL